FLVAHARARKTSREEVAELDERGIWVDRQIQRRHWACLRARLPDHLSHHLIRGLAGEPLVETVEKTSAVLVAEMLQICSAVGIERITQQPRTRGNVLHLIESHDIAQQPHKGEIDRMLKGGGDRRIALVLPFVKVSEALLAAASEERTGRT